MLWHHDPGHATGQKPLETGHDLGKVLRMVQRLGKLQSGGRDDPLTDAVRQVMRL